MPNKGPLLLLLTVVFALGACAGTSKDQGGRRAPPPDRTSGSESPPAPRPAPAPTGEDRGGRNPGGRNPVGGAPVGGNPVGGNPVGGNPAGGDPGEREGAQPAFSTADLEVEWGSGGEWIRDFFEWIGGDRPPSRPLKKIGEIHNLKDWTHRIEFPNAAETCREAVQDLARSTYGTWSETAFVVYVLSKMAVHDPAAISRSESILSLATMRGWIHPDAEGLSAAIETSEKDVVEAMNTLKRLRVKAGKAITAQDRLACVSAITVLGSHSWHEGPTGDPALISLSGPRAMILKLTGPGLRPYLANPLTRDTLDRALLRVIDQAILLTEVVALADPVPFVRGQAAKALMAAADPRTVGSLLWALEREEQASVKLSLLAAIGELASADSRASNRVTPALAQALKDSDSSVRYAAARELDRVTGLALGTDPTIWLRWWNEQHGEVLER